MNFLIFHHHHFIAIYEDVGMILSVSWSDVPVVLVVAVSIKLFIVRFATSFLNSSLSYIFTILIGIIIILKKCFKSSATKHLRWRREHRKWLKVLRFRFYRSENEIIHHSKWDFPSSFYYDLWAWWDDSKCILVVHSPVMSVIVVAIKLFLTSSVT